MSDQILLDDVILSGPFVSSKKASAEMRRLAAVHGLGFTFNPGGGEYYSSRDDKWRCQIACCDDVGDLQKLRHAVRVFEQRKSGE